MNTALDEIGATIGPLLIALILLLRENYQVGYALLLIPTAGACLPCRCSDRLPTPIPSGGRADRAGEGFTSAYWLYMLAGGCFAAGLMSFELISYHLSTTKTVSEHWIPVFFAISTAFGVVASLILGKLYDKVGLPIVLIAVFLSSLFSPLVFLGGFFAALIGMLLWGVGYATQDTLLKAVVAGVLPEGKRNLAFGLFYAGYGLGWLIAAL